MTTTTRNKTVTTLALSVLCLLSIVRTHAAGLTLITHGLNGNANGWVTAMANRIPVYPTFPGTSHTFYKVYFVSAGAGVYQMAWSRAGGVAPAVNDSGEIIVALDWGPLADGTVFSTHDVAGYVSAALQNPGFISELNGRALCELPTHMVGHSRGGSLISELSFRLGTNGLWVDHLTTLDPHPLNDPSFPLDFLISSVVDAPARTYRNVLFHDNYWQDLDAFVYGKSVPGAYVRELYNLSGGFSSSHSDVHLWYHATVDQRNPADNSEAQLNRTGSAWYSAYENFGFNAGYKWSRIGGGNRMSLDQPYGAGYPSIVQGYNGAWDLGSGLAANRAALPNNNGSWPNVIRMNCTSGAAAAQNTEIAVDYYYQWAQPATSNANITLFLDDDDNPAMG